MSWLRLARARPRTAADWFALRRARSDPRLEREFREWLTEHPSHAEEFALCEITWEVAGEAAATIPLPDRRRRHRTLLLGSLAAATCAAVVALVALWWPVRIERWSTAPGEQRTVVLADGSRVTLNTRTRVSVRLGRRTRDVLLEDGEAYFDVAKDPSRPFTVRTSLGTARALGTRFNVYLEESTLSVTTEQGQVLVNGAVGGHDVIVDAGRQAEVHAGLSQPVVRPADLASALSWRHERLEADNVPLERLLRDFSRYTVRPIRAATAEIGALRVTAVLRTGDVAALEAMLKGALALEVEPRDGALVVVPARRGTPSDGPVRRN